MRKRLGNLFLAPLGSLLSTELQYRRNLHRRILTDEMRRHRRAVDVRQHTPLRRLRLPHIPPAVEQPENIDKMGPSTVAPLYLIWVPGNVGWVRQDCSPRPVESPDFRALACIPRRLAFALVSDENAKRPG